MSETADYDPGPWEGHDFKSARRAYDAYAGRSYGDAIDSGKTASDLVPNFISTNSDSPLIVVCDVTGSMGEWPAVIFSKLPYLDIEGKQYLGENMEICFGAVGDANSDKYPLQVMPFSKGLDLEQQLKQLVIEGGGGGQTTETYELAALYLARNMKTPKARRKPIVIFIGDEQPYQYVERAQANKYSKTLINQRMSTEDVFAELRETCSVYLVRKPYDRSSCEPEIKRHWEKLLGADHIAELPDASRIVDVIFGILAAEVNKIDYFHEEIEDRQRPDQVKTVYKSLMTIHSSATRHTGKSVMLKPSKGKHTRSLLDE